MTAPENHGPTRGGVGTNTSVKKALDRIDQLARDEIAPTDTGAAASIIMAVLTVRLCRARQDGPDQMPNIAKEGERLGLR